MIETVRLRNGIDTVAAYSNEISLSRVIAEAGMSRNELIITDKVWNTGR